jgi:hypothetical protein
VDVLSGIRIEATESLDAALNYYRQFLEIDPTNVVSIPGSKACPLADVA